MQGKELLWTPDPFHTAVERRDDGTIYLQPTASLPPYPERLMDSLERWAQLTPQRVLVARRASGGEWQTVTYAQMLARVRRIAAGLLTRELSAERPLAILSGNSIEHLTLAFAAMWAGVPYCPISPTYSQVSKDLEKLNYVLQLLTPGLLAAFDTASFQRALAVPAAAALEIIGDAQIAGRTVTALSALEAEPTALLDAA